MRSSSPSGAEQTRLLTEDLPPDAYNRCEALRKEQSLRAPRFSRATNVRIAVGGERARVPARAGSCPHLCKEKTCIQRAIRLTRACFSSYRLSTCRTPGEPDFLLPLESPDRGPAVAPRVLCPTQCVIVKSGARGKKRAVSSERAAATNVRLARIRLAHLLLGVACTVLGDAATPFPSSGP